MVLKKETTIYERDNKGELIPSEVKVAIDTEDEKQVEYTGETIFLIPATRGELKRLFADLAMKKEAEDESTRDFDGEMISKYCKTPAYTKEEVKYIKPALANIIVNTIFRESGIETGKSRKKAILKAEDDFAKN